MDGFNNVAEVNRDTNSSRFAVWVLGLVAILLPVFFIPSMAVSIPVAKMILLSVGILAALAAVILSTIQHGEIRIPWNLMTAGVLSLPLAFLVASIFSPTPSNSLWGYGYENGTFGFILICSLATLLLASLYRDKAKQGMILWGTLIASCVLGIFHIARFIFGASKLSFGLFVDNFANTVGTWNELSVWFGFIAIVSAILLSISQPQGKKKFIAYLSLLVSVVMMFIINFLTAWYLVGAFALVFMVFELSRTNMSADGATRRKISWHALFLVILALVCVLANNVISTSVTQKMGIATVEVRPAWVATWDVLKSTLTERVLIGTGANNFTSAWLTHKPAGINDTIFWNSDFTTGIGLIPTFAVTTGLLGIIAWLFFLVLVIRNGIRLLFREGVDVNEKLYSIISVFATFFLWAVAFFYTPSSALLAMAFIFTGLMIASMYRAGYLKEKGFSLFSVPRASFVSVLVLIVVLIGVVSLGFLFVERAIAQVYFGEALVAGNNSQIDNAENYLNRAIAIHPFDTFYRSLSNVSMTKLSNLLQDQNAKAEDVRSGFQNLLSSGIRNAQLATQVNPSSYQNWMNLAQVFGSVVPKPFQIKDAYESSKDAYGKAKALNPYSPSIMLSMARLELDSGNLVTAASFAEEAVKLKNDYADAHFFLSQIAVQQGNVQRAIEKTQTTILLSPQNAGLYFQLGVLYFNVPDYSRAALALAQAVQILPEYANARYFLGLSLARTGDKAGATAQFEALQKTNPDNTEIVKVLANLKAGKDPLSGITGGASKPAERTSLPVTQ
ncbi:MAG: tetratricopeptide repeat protein [Minisyncoccia bacterium]